MKKILIANRGEIAERIIRTCSKLGLETVAVYSSADKDLPYVKQATVAYEIGDPPAAKSYLNQDKILRVASEENVDAIHPGYGFLSENAAFVRKINEQGITFIGPSADVVEAMGDKITARKTMQEAGVPVVPGSGEIVDVAEAIAFANEINYPIMLKAAAGGGGIGMQRCENDQELEKAFVSSQNRAKAYFGNGAMFVEKFIDDARHIEVQIVGDNHGNIVHMNERDCSIQRRNQKVLEEAPSPFLSKSTRIQIGEAALLAAKHVQYTNAGTVEFVMDKDENFYFLEMNTRLQVEHPITEETIGVDLVEWQINVAEGKALPLKQEDIQPTGHSIELRLYAEDPTSFMPSPGKIETLHFPKMEGVRIDSGYESGSTVSPFYDPMIAKIIVSGSSREEAIKRCTDFFSSFSLTGIKHNGPLFAQLLKEENFQQGKYSTSYLSKILVKK
ncbi:acetyl-CoA carboxylase biotin carboxylase subunit [Pseudalkalibacillus hwajinpoensis]|uniref:acetyl-CoA carboxylase biotin carboxylase subunit n=1 Tax=Guptibacillus hwajinpoensis TaxID=208199 RepID=UPI001CD7B906|nr:acetyl-CoA carboxylase biotin carboxylase subunit [Pseudalkalibacillus hwajinpoensis]MCA0990122.1 acetyl-CoA carboxylase biotin carboxylase subunit [Pseudalkalibacillus hwajinpoensis]